MSIFRESCADQATWEKCPFRARGENRRLTGSEGRFTSSQMQLRRFRGLPLIGILAVIYFIAGKLGLMLASLHASASPVWPPAGIALAALLLLGYRAWPAIFVGAFLVNVTTAGNVATFSNLRSRQGSAPLLALLSA
jgi:integral membrane sensor domain MASE1